MATDVLSSRATRWPWPRVVRWTFAGLFLLLGFLYALAVIRYQSSSPRITRDYLAEVNALSQAVPVQERAWTRYRQALNQLEAIPGVGTDDDGGAAFDQSLMDWFQRNTRSIAELRAAARMPRLGYVFRALGDPYDPADAAWMRRHEKHFDLSDFRYGSTSTLDHLGNGSWESCPLWHIATLLRYDAEYAARVGDSTRMLDDLLAINSICDQLRDVPGEPNAMICLGLAHVVCNHAVFLLDRYPVAWSAETLERAATAFAQEKSFPSGFAPNGTARSEFYDYLQRIYTDNGRGDGHWTWDETLFSYAAWVPKATAPVISVWMPSRQALAARFEDRMARHEKLYELPRWQCDPAAIDALQSEEFTSIVSNVGNIPVFFATSTASAVHTGREAYVEALDVLRVVLALHRYERAHNAWPASLQALVPRYLPAIPVDPYSGKPLCYTLRSGQPQLYRVGDNRTDDGGLNRNEDPEQILTGDVDDITIFPLKRPKPAAEAPPPEPEARESE